MPPISSARPENRLAPAAQVDPGHENNFSHYLDKKVRAGSQEGSDLLGVKNRERPPKDKDEPKEKTNKSAMSAAAFLQQLLVDLRTLAKKPGTDAGQWSFQLKSMAMLNKMAEQVGMKPAELAPLKEQMAKNGTVSLADIFAVFAKHLQLMQTPQKITAPETDLPLLESMLSRMGVDTDKLAELSAKSIDNQGKFDLTAYLRGLKTISASRLKTIKMSGVELAQIKDMLASAGVSKDGMANIFPKTIAAFKRDLAGMPPLVDSGKESMGLGHLKEILTQGLADVKAQRPKVNLPGFLRNLSAVLGQAGFVKHGVSFTPVVQASLTAAYQDLQKMIDLAKVKINKVSDVMGLKQDLAEEWQKSGRKDFAAPLAADSAVKKDITGVKGILTKILADVEAANPGTDLSALRQAVLAKQGAGSTPAVRESLTSVYQDLQKMIDIAKIRGDKVSEIMSLKHDLAEEWQKSGKKDFAAPFAAATADKNGVIESVIKVIEADAKNLLSDAHHKNSFQDAENTLIANIDARQASGSTPLRSPPVMRLPAARILQQFAMEQISQGVARGLADAEHHLTLTMYPKELGEVKVDMQIRNNHLAVSFVMDNHRVKEALEKNMEEFKDNLNRQGYSLEACAVMVDQRKNDSGGARQQFESAWEQLSVDGAANRPGAAGVGGPGESLRQIASLHSSRWPESSISVFA